MKKNLRKLLVSLLSVAVISTMSVSVFAADGAPNEGTSKTTSIEETIVTSTKAKDIISTLGMFSPGEGTTKVEIDKIKGTATVTFTTTPQSRQYTKIALVKQSKTDAAKNEAAIQGTVKESSNGKYVSTFTFTISVSQLGKQIPISTYNIYTKGDVTENAWHDWSAQHYLKICFTSSIVNDLTSAIYYQERTEGTDALCEAAGRGWNSLTDEEKEQVGGFGYYKDEDETKGGYEYFAEDTGDATADDPLNQNDIGKTELLVASFGTSYNDSRVATIGGIESALEKAYPELSVRRGFTSQIIINHIQARDGEIIDNIDQAVQRAINNGVKVLIVQPTTLMSGAEYDELVAAVNQYKTKFTQVIFSKPICNTDEDRTTVATSVYEAAAAASTLKTVDAAKASTDTAFVFMGHGTSHAAKDLYTKMQAKFKELGYNNAFVGTVEGNPESTSCENVIAAVKAAGYTNVVLRPLMVVAGDHANNDMAGDDDDSWKSMFTAAGLNVTTQIKGLGEIDAVKKLCVEHTKDALENVANPATTSISKVTVGNKKATVAYKETKGIDGYQVRYSTSKSMSGAKTKTIDGYVNTKASITGLTAGKTYYFQVRTYKNTDSNRVYSSWSGSKSIKAVAVKGTSFSKLTAGSKKVTVTIKKQSSMSGYQVRYSTSKSMKSAKTCTIKSYKTTKKTISKLKGKKTYYFQVRTYVKTSSGNLYSSWSTAKKITTKK